MKRPPFYFIMAKMTLDFIDDIDADIKNWQRSVTAKSHGVDWKKFLPDDITVEEVDDGEYLKGYLNDRYYDSGKVAEFKGWLEANVKADLIEEDLRAITGGTFLGKGFKVYITTFHRAPYDLKERSFHVILKEKKEYSITNIYHELMHFIFYELYWKKCMDSGLNEKKTDDFKEALTVILNPTLAKRGLPLDKGYLVHQELRTKLLDLWESDEWRFADFLNEAIKRFY